LVQKTGSGHYKLRQSLAELAKHDERGWRIFLEISFRERTQPDELRIMHSKEREIRSCDLFRHFGLD
jgi:hypothetical protein